MPSIRSQLYNAAKQLASELALPKIQYASSSVQSLRRFIGIARSVRTTRLNYVDQIKQLARVKNLPADPQLSDPSLYRTLNRLRQTPSKAKLVPNTLIKLNGGSFRKLNLESVPNARKSFADSSFRIMRPNVNGSKAIITFADRRKITPVISIALGPSPTAADVRQAYLGFLATQNRIDEGTYNDSTQWVYLPRDKDLTDVGVGPGYAIRLDEPFPENLPLKAKPFVRASAAEVKKALIENPLYAADDGLCVPRGLLSTLRGMPRFKRMSIDGILAEFQQLYPGCIDDKGKPHINSEMVMAWCHKKRLTLRVCDYDGRLILSAGTELSNRGSVVYSANNSHMEILTGSRRQAALAGKLFNDQPDEKSTVEFVKHPDVQIEYRKAIAKAPIGSIIGIKTGVYYAPTRYYDTSTNTVVIARPHLDRDRTIHTALAKLGSVPNHMSGDKLPSLARAHFDHYACPPKSSLNDCVRDSILASPNSYKFIGQAHDDLDQSYDISKCQTSALFYRQHRFGVFDSLCEWAKVVIDEEFTIHQGARYRINQEINLEGHIIAAGHNFDSQFVQWTIDEGYVNIMSCDMVLMPSSTIPADTFQQAISKAYESGHGKSVVNAYIGSLGAHHYNDQVGYLTDEFRAELATRQGNVVCEEPNGQYLVHSITRRPISENSLPIYRCIIEANFVDLARLTKMAGGRTHSWVTDCIVGSGYNDITGQWLYPENEFNFGRVRLEKLSPRMPTITVQEDRLLGYRPKPSGVYKPPAQVRTSPQELVHTGGVMTGAPGTGKSYTLANTIIPECKKHSLRYKVCAPTHAAVNVHKQLGVSSSTAHKLLTRAPGIPLDPIIQLAKTTDVLIIDEATMLDQVLCRALYSCHQKGIKIVLIGDGNQLPAVDTIQYNIFDADFVQGMCPSHHHLTQVHRYDDALAQALGGVLQGQMFHGKPIGPNPLEYTHLAYYNRTVNAINEDCRQMFAPDSNEPFPVGAPVVCTTNDLNDSWNGRMGTVCPNRVINGVQYSAKALKKHFKLAWAITVHKAQGKQYHGKIAIHDADDMSVNMLYTALSRATKLDHIHCDAAVPPKPNIWMRMSDRDTKNMVAKPAETDPAGLSRRHKPPPPIKKRQSLGAAEPSPKQPPSAEAKMGGTIKISTGKHVLYRWSILGQRKEKKWRISKKRTLEQALELAKAFQASRY